MDDKVTHFISGLPRSGPTLLAALLRQIPRFHAVMSSALARRVNANLSITSVGSDIFQLMDDHQRPAILRAIFREYCATTKAESGIKLAGARSSG